MQNLEGKRVALILDKATLELEKQYQRRRDALTRSEIMRTLYYKFLKSESKEKYDR